ncbi:MAG: AzlC family ABC transporter permease, partial [Clostridia bacterium]|nr:AzlC family ABC transporter permease [Clostridia bacterium]
MKNSVITYAFKKSIPVLLGYIFLGIAFGITAQSAGFRIPWIILTSVIIYAGSMQFALVPLMVSSASLPIVALTTLMVNSRHLFYGISFIDDFAQMGKRRPYMIFSLTDETFATLTSCKNEPIA